MNTITTYQPWFTVTIQHAYYGQGSLPLRLTPTVETDTFFRQWNILLRQVEPSKWVFLKGENRQTEEIEKDDIPLLTFELSPLDSLFHYVSTEISPNTSVTVTNPQKPTIWRQITIYLRRLFLQPSTDILITIPARRVYFEYILIPRYHRPETKIRCTEKRDKFQLNGPFSVSLPGIPVAFRFLSDQAIELSHENNYTVQLWEIKETGEQLLAERLPVPQPSQASIIDPNNVCTVYFYY